MVQRLSGRPDIFVYRLSLRTQTIEKQARRRPIAQTKKQPGVSPIPANAVQLTMQLSVSESSPFKNDPRLENEIAMMTLLRQAIDIESPGLVPQIHDWGSGGREIPGYDWVIFEALPGVLLSDEFESLSDDAKRDVVAQMARILRSIRQFKLPDSVFGYGGMRFGKDGKLVMGPNPLTGGGGPFKTHGALYASYLQSQLRLAEECDVVQGWRDTAARERIEELADTMLMGRYDSERALRPTIVHGDFGKLSDCNESTPKNKNADLVCFLDTHSILFDPQSNRITGLLNYDLSHIGSQADEYFFSLMSLHSLVTGPVHDDPDAYMLRFSLLHGHDQLRGELSPSSGLVNWKLALLVAEELAKAGLERPIDIPGMNDVSARYWFTKVVHPVEFCIIKMGSEERQAIEEDKDKAKRRALKRLEQYLQAWGF